MNMMMVIILVDGVYIHLQQQLIPLMFILMMSKEELKQLLMVLFLTTHPQYMEKSSLDGLMTLHAQLVTK